jgi:hypothetical protein
MTCFVQKYSNTNIVIIRISHTSNLDKTSAVNSKIHAFNRELLKVAKSYSHVTIVQTNLERKLLTRHGIHLNKKGKEWLSKLLATQISSVTVLFFSYLWVQVSCPLLLSSHDGLISGYTWGVSESHLATLDIQQYTRASRTIYFIYCFDTLTPFNYKH